MIGNNPIELSRIFNHLEKIHGRKVITEIAFDLKSSIHRLLKFRPSFIIIDDNIGRTELKESVQYLLFHRTTKNIPITILKSSNYHEAVNAGVMNYILKENLTGESLLVTLKNSLKFQRTQKYLRQAYNKRKGQLSRILRLS